MNNYLKKIFSVFVLLIFQNVTYAASILFVSENKNISVQEIKRPRYTDKDLNSFFSSKELGSIVEMNKTTFRLFAPNPLKVELVIFNNVEDNNGTIYELIKDSNGVWETEINEDLSGKYYNYLVYHKNHIDENIKPWFR